ncbi:hypothetical protein CVT24_009581 [Panaeolus cyanescens]|uniref:FAD-binding FR-type domain-containing protein n=1 Tax=Panaeolus cyanescens TaxID=181874 RepID=A0A409YA80_9AGAR|nr:hypothetical protein CVT24_009581 [Panaeolus cyanescens]
MFVFAWHSSIRKTLMNRWTPFLRRLSSSPPCYLRNPSKRLFSSQGTSNRVSLPVKLGLLSVTGGSLALYFLLPDKSRGAPTSTRLPLSPSHFTPTTVLENLDSGGPTKLLRLNLAPELRPTADSLLPIWSVYIKDNDIQVERPYTPLYGLDDEGNMLFWIKKYPKGEVGRWLHSKNPGEQIELRGPIPTWPLQGDNKWDEVVMISGGTGITPFIQLFFSTISKPHLTPNTQFTLLHSSRRPGELPPAELLQPLIDFSSQNPQRLKFELFVDADDGAHPPLAVPKLHIGRIAEKNIKECVVAEQERPSWWQWFSKKRDLDAVQRRKVLFLVCGPEPFVKIVLFDA